MTPFLVLERLEKSFGATRVLHGLSLDLGEGEVLALLGPSGSGKTTALRLIAGFETPDPGGGRILVGGEDVTGLPPAKRRFGMVFQHYALFPHLSVGGNISFGLEGRRSFGLEGRGAGGAGAGRRLDGPEIAARVAAALALVDLAGFERRRVGEISGGQQQRVALARALAPEPRVLLLDEPLSNLDPALRERTRRELRRAIERVGITTLLVTHEQEEAFQLGDRVAVLEGGVLHQVGNPQELYERPATRFVATFVGRASGLPGTFETDTPNPGSGPGEGRVRLASAGGSAVWAGIPAEPMAAGESAELVIRPEALAFVPPGTAGALAGRVLERRYAGPVTYYQVEVDLAGARAEATGTAGVVEVLAGPRAASPGEQVAVAPANGPAARIFRRGAAAAPPSAPSSLSPPSRPSRPSQSSPPAEEPGS
ncbi:MAG TPA: ABC transporter ATP-binding protein [Thermoanaerobaculia bacterium]|nr:ABC transporter ATP-binding protein [Thermoanaerobaculia bacterium]